MATPTHTPLLTPMRMQILVGGTSILFAFVFGIQSAGELSPIDPIRAESTRIEGDVDQDGILTASDVLVILESAQGYREATVPERLNDPNGDYELTVDDAISVLRSLR